MQSKDQRQTITCVCFSFQPINTDILMCLCGITYSVLSGSVEILRNIDNIDFKVLMSGKICYDEIPRVKKLARLDCIQMPAFMRNQEKYKKILKQIAHMNGLHLEHAKFKAPLAYLRRLKKGRRIGVAKGSKKVRKKGKKGVMGKGSLDMGKSENTYGHLGSDDDESDDDEDKFFFQHYSMSAGSTEDNFFETMKRNMGKNTSNSNDKVSDEVFNYNYLKGLVDKSDKSKASQPSPHPEKPKQTAVDSLFTTPSDSSSKRELRDWENDCVKTGSRCVSRASVQLMLNLPSKSLNSRAKSSHVNPLAATPITKDFTQRPLSNIESSRTTNVDPSIGNTDFEEDSKVSKVQPAACSAVNLVSQCDNESTSSHISSSEHDSINNNQMRTRSNNKNQVHPFSASDTNRVKKDADGFIYPDNDILTEDMIRVNSALQRPVSSRGPSSSLSTSSNPKLLNRRIKSAANILPSY